MPPLPMAPRSCARFESCNAAVCPLAEDWRSAAHLPGERVCYYLLASGKAGAQERFADDPVFAACLERLPAVAAKHAAIRRTVEKAARTGFRGNFSWGRGRDSGVSDPSEAAQGGPAATEGPAA